MNKKILAVLAFGMLLASRAFAFGFDVGPFHVHGAHVVVGDEINLKIVIDTVATDKDTKAMTLYAHRKGDLNDDFTIKAVSTDMDDKSREKVRDLKLGIVYDMRLQKQDVGWKLLKIRELDW